MVRATVAAGMAVVTACVAFGQSADTPLKFEVASIKPAPPPPDGRLMIRMGGGPGRLDYSSVSLRAMIQRACEVQDYQVSGPDWMGSTRFDVVAKLPSGAPRSKIPEMLQSLLAERFKLAVHRETRELPVYALVVGKNGPKMKESEVDPNAPPPDGNLRTGAPASNGGPEFAPGLDCGPRGESAVPAGWFRSKGPGQWEGHTMNMASLVNLLGVLLGRPVEDRTGLKGNYDFDLAYSPDEGPPVSPAGGEATAPSVRDHDVNGVSLFTAVQSQLGLKLDNRRGPVDLIVVDHVEQSPTEN